MPVVIRGEEINEITIDHCQVAPLLTPEAIGNDQISLDRITLEKDTSFNLVLDGAAVGWVQILAGCVKINDTDEQLTPDHITYLPLGYSNGITAVEGGTSLLLAQLPDAARFDNEIAKMPNSIRSIDWTREPVLQSEHDARTRIYMATPIQTGTNAFKGEIITYPPDTAAPEHHHEGAKHFQYMVVGQCTALLNGVATQLMAGDVLYNYENEIHAFINEGTEDLVFVEFFVQGHAKQSGYLGPICAPVCQPGPQTHPRNWLSRSWARWRNLTRGVS